MVVLIFIAIVVLIVLFKVGVFNKDTECQCCHRTLKGTEQKIWGKKEKFILCKECADKVHPQLVEYAKEYWNYDNFEDYLKWEEETREERSLFNPTNIYGYAYKILIDEDNYLFRIDDLRRNGIVLRFQDLKLYIFDFSPDEVKQGIFNTKVKGNEVFNIMLSRPRAILKGVLANDIEYKAKEKGIINTKYEYELSETFMNIIRLFSICEYVSKNKDVIFFEIQNALSVLQLDSMADVTEENLKTQKTFLSRNGSESEDLEKINNAYDLLMNAVTE